MNTDKILIAPSILSADFSRLGEELKAIEAGGADWLHVDVMDGAFVPNITIGSVVVKSIRPASNLFFDVHLMIDDPIRYIDQFSEAGSDSITFHIEACKSPEDIIKKIKDNEKKVGVSIKPGTDISVLDGILDQVDLVLVMTVEPGFGGQSFITGMMDKVKELKQRFNGCIEIDGGINRDTAKVAIDSGANALVAGTAVFREEDYGRIISDLRG